MKNVAVAIMLFVVSWQSLTPSAGINRHDVEQWRYIELAAAPAFDCVGHIQRSEKTIASCVMIGPRHVLTAAHVLQESDLIPDTTYTELGMEVAYRRGPSRLLRAADVQVHVQGRTYAVATVIVHPASMTASGDGVVDVAILELRLDVTACVPARLYAGTDERGRTAVGVGYGAWGSADAMKAVTDRPLKIAGENDVDSIGGPSVDGVPTRMFCDMDHPTTSHLNVMGSPIPRELEYIATGGDSGGGLFMQIDGTWVLVGILHGTRYDMQRAASYGYYGQVMIWTRVSALRQWIEKSIG